VSVSAWDERIAAFAATRDLLALLADPDDPQMAAEAERLFWMALASGWFTAFAESAPTPISSMPRRRSTDRAAMS